MWNSPSQQPLGEFYNSETFDEASSSPRCRRRHGQSDHSARESRCHVVAIEPARGMLEQLQAKRGDTKVLAVVAEGARLPFPAEHFEVVVIARLLYLTRDWRAILREAHRVHAGRGCPLHEWGNGEVEEEWVRIREEARRLFEAAGLKAPFHSGVRSESEGEGQLAALQLVREGPIEMGPGPAITLREFLRRLVEGKQDRVLPHGSLRFDETG